VKAVSIASVAVAVLSGLLVLLGSFLAIPTLQNIRSMLLGWAVVLAAVAGLAAILNLIFGVHLRRVLSKAPGSGYSIVAVAAFLVVLVTGLIVGSRAAVMSTIVRNLMRPIEASLMAVTAVSLAMAGARLLRKRQGVFSILFLSSTVVFLLVGSGFIASQTALPVVGNILSALESLPLAGVRGILIGMGLGALLAGLRVLFGADRPYGG
jgi:hypothetical protein